MTEEVPCGLCGRLTKMTNTKRCDPCWELERRIQSNPDMARKILASLRSAEEFATPFDDVVNFDFLRAKIRQEDVSDFALSAVVAKVRKELRKSAPSSGGVAPEVRLNNDGTLDEVCTPLFHLEQMDYNHWFLEIVHGGQAVAVWLHAKGKITASYEHRRTERGDQL